MRVSNLTNYFNELDKKILGEIYSSKETMDNLIILCDEYNSRWPGSGDDRRACEYMLGKLKEYGLENPHMESLPLTGWMRGPSRLMVTQPIEKEIPCIALPHSIEGEVEAELVFLEDGPVNIYEKRKEEIKGNITMVTSRTPLGMARRMHRGEKYNRSVLAGADGFIFMNHYPTYGPPTGGVGTIIPAVGVSYEDGCFLARLLRQKGRVRVRIETHCRNLDVESWNVVAQLPGSNDEDEMVVYGAHYDGHDIAVGALDDATGAVCVMEIARVLTKVKKHIKRQFRFVLFAAEEIGLYGSRAYVKQHVDEIENIRLMLNLDGAARAGRQGFMLNGWPALEPFFRTVENSLGIDIPIWQDLSPNSDHWPFLQKGVPTACMGDPEEEIPWRHRGFGHTIHDTVDKANIRLHKECVANAAVAAMRIANTNEWPVEHRSQEAINELIDVLEYKEIQDLQQRVKEYLLAKRA
jgi:hypothetical protein